MITVIQQSILTKKMNQMTLPITEEQLIRFQRGELAQQVFPNLNEDQREFMITGVTPEEWKQTFKNL